MLQAPEKVAFSPTAVQFQQACKSGFENWLCLRNYAPSVRYNRMRSVAKWLDFLGADDLRKVTHSRVRDFLAGTEKASVRRERLDGVRSFYRFLLLAGVVHFSPAAFIESQRQPPPKLPRVLTKQEIDRLMAAAANPRDRAVLELFYATGCRISEIARLKVGDVDFRQREIRVLGKGNRERIALFGKAAADALTAYLDGRKNGLLFPGRMLKRAAPWMLRNIIKAVGNRAGLRVRPHMLRHSVATHLLTHGANLGYVREFLGHRSLSSTQIYTHVAIDDLARVHEQCHPHSKGENNA